MSTPEQRIHAATRRLIPLLETTSPTAPEVVSLRAELALATAADGHVDEAFYQAMELLKDVRREYGPDHELEPVARRTVAEVERLAEERPAP